MLRLEEDGSEVRFCKYLLPADAVARPIEFPPRSVGAAVANAGIFKPQSSNTYKVFFCNIYIFVLIIYVC